MHKENIKLPNKLMANSLLPEHHAHGYKSTWQLDYGWLFYLKNIGHGDVMGTPS